MLIVVLLVIEPHEIVYVVVVCIGAVAYPPVQLLTEELGGEDGVTPLRSAFDGPIEHCAIGVIFVTFHDNDAVPPGRTVCIPVSKETIVAVSAKAMAGRINSNKPARIFLLDIAHSIPWHHTRAEPRIGKLLSERFTSSTR